MAFNDDRSESKLDYFTPNGLNKIVLQANTVIEAGDGALKGVASDTNLGMQLWKLCIILALIFLAAEILLIRFFKTDQIVDLQVV